MQKIYCDRCGCELTTLTDFRVVIGGTPVESFDLCGDCREDLIDWLAGCQTVETAVDPAEASEDARVAEAKAAFEKAMAEAEAEDPLYDGPRNDKTGYTVEDLMDVTGKSFYGVLSWLERIGVTAVCWKRDGKSVYRFFLSPRQIEALKK